MCIRDRGVLCPDHRAVWLWGSRGLHAEPAAHWPSRAPCRTRRAGADCQERMREAASPRGPWALVWLESALHEVWPCLSPLSGACVQSQCCKWGPGDVTAQAGPERSGGSERTRNRIR
eukprot:11832512-Alexandrium_andersonii.AAC.1